VKTNTDILKYSRRHLAWLWCGSTTFFTTVLRKSDEVKIFKIQSTWAYRSNRNQIL